MSGSWYNDGDIAESPFGDGTINGYGQSMAASNDEAAPMHMDDNMFGRSHCICPGYLA